ncbi:MAG: hypothetical protein ACI8W3_003189 [Myxococcota bacterium]
MTQNLTKDSSTQASGALPAQTHAAALSIEVRSPLARIELAASQLYREALTPNARAQSDQIFEAVAEVDRLIERILRVLVPPKHDAELSGDLALVLSELRTRFVPAFAACDVEWKWRDFPREPVIGNTESVRKLGTELLHLALTLSGNGGQFTLDASRRDTSISLSMFCRRATPCNDDEQRIASAAIHHAKAFALEEGATLSATVDSTISDVRLDIVRTADQALETIMPNPVGKSAAPDLETS